MHIIAVDQLNDSNESLYTFEGPIMLNSENNWKEKKSIICY